MILIKAIAFTAVYLVGSVLAVQLLLALAHKAWTGKWR